jgi:Flp pilus assembly protein TadD
MVAAVSVSVRAADPDPTRHAIERMLGDGQAEAARQRIEAVLKIKPDDPALRFLLGVALTESRREGEARTVYQQLIQDYPELPEPYNNLAVLQAANGEWDSARSLLEAALRNDPKYTAAHRNLGDVFVRLALREYEAAAVNAKADDVLARRLRLARELATVGSRQ